MGFQIFLEGCRNHNIEHLVYASSSSVYGNNTNHPFSEEDTVDHPISLYGATKKANELMAHSYSHLFSCQQLGYDFLLYMAHGEDLIWYLFLFTKAMLAGEKINVFNNGKMFRDFTFIDDIIESLVKLIKKPPLKNPNFDRKNPNPSSSWCPYKVFNIGNSQPRSLMEYISSMKNASK